MRRAYPPRIETFHATSIKGCRYITKHNIVNIANTLVTRRPRRDSTTIYDIMKIHSIRHTASTASLLIPLAVLTLMLVACAGPDFMPDYFGLRSGGAKEDIESPETEAPPAEEEELKIDAFKLIVGPDGREKETPVPSGKILEISSSTFISRNETEIGTKFTAVAKFKFINKGSKPLSITIPSQKGPFFISSIGTLPQKLAPNQFIILTITFRPTADIIGKSGKIVEKLDIGGVEFDLTGMAIEPSGLAAVNIVDEAGKVEIANISTITFGEVSLSAHPARRFFKCSKIQCGGELMPARCAECIDMLGGSCELLIVNKSGEPIDEMDDKCQPVHKDMNPASEINLTGSGEKKAEKKIIEVINIGTEPLIIKSIGIKEINSSKSTGQFSVNQSAAFTADSFDGAKRHATFPIVLPPFDPPIMTMRLFIAVAYHPSDILGSDGVSAAVGSSAKDEAYLTIKYENAASKIALVGTTSIKEIPALEVYVKSSTGVRPIANGDTLPFKGITSATRNIPLPLFMKLSDSATEGLKITSITLSGTNFEWLDTPEKIAEKPEGTRCTIPILDNDGNLVDTIENPDPVALAPRGFNLEPGVYTLANMPFFGCINFTRNSDSPFETTVFSGEMTITAETINPQGAPLLNPDGSTKETTFAFSLLGVIDPLKGKLVMRMTQTMAALMVPQFSSINSAPSKDILDILIADGEASESDRNIFIMSMILDPYDEETILNPDGSIASTPGDGITAIFRPIDTRAIPVTYNDPTLSDYTSLIHNSLLPEDEQGIFSDYPNLPEDYRTGALKIFTSTLSYPGPLAPAEEKPKAPSKCEKIDPCTVAGQKKLAEGPSNPSYKGVCTFFHVTAGRNDSPAFSYPTENPGGTRRPMCENREQPYELNSIKGKYFLDGRMEFDNVAILFQGPTYFHNPAGPLGPVPPMDEMFLITFTTETLLPISETKDIDRIPNKRIDIAKGEYKINLNDTSSELPELCKNNTKNEVLRGKRYSTWRYLAKLLKKDKEGKIPAGCPEEDNNFTGGIAYLSGKRLDHETGHATFVGVSKFSSNDDLTFAFKDVIIFMILNGWFCDPSGPEEEMEGKYCYDKKFNYRDEQSQFSIVRGGN